jgi:hypothetical protein
MRPRRDNKRTTSPPRFLAVATEKKIISASQAREIYATQRRWRSKGDKAPPVGEIGREMRILTQDEITQILAASKKTREEGRRLRDPISESPKPSEGSPPSWFRQLMGVILLLAVVGGGIWRGSFTAAAEIASIGAAAWMAIEGVFWSRASARPVGVRLLGLLLQLTVPLSVLAVILFGRRLFQALHGVESTVTVPDLRGDRLGLEVSIGALALSAGYFLLIAAWRHTAIASLKSRIRHTRRMLFRYSQLIIRGPGNGRRSMMSQRRRAIRGVLEETAHVLRQNPWDRAVEWSLPGHRSVGAVSLWYLEPNADPQAGFDIFAFAAPLAPGEVMRAFRRIQARHHPVRLNHAAWDAAIGSCTSDGVLDRAQFLKRTDRHTFVSLTGYVFDKGHAQHAGDVRRCLAYEQSYVRVLDLPNQPSIVREWLNFQSVAAIPVCERDGNRWDTVGVLMAFKNVQNGITPEDMETLRMASDLLGNLKCPARPTGKEAEDGGR